MYQKLILTHNTSMLYSMKLISMHGHSDVLEAIWVEDISHAQFLQDQFTNSMSSVVEEASDTTELLSCVCTGTGSKLNG